MGPRKMLNDLVRSMNEETGVIIPFSGHQVSTSRMLQEARDLIEGGGENPEYDRALCELIARCIPVGMETGPLALLIAKAIGVKSKLYD